MAKRPKPVHQLTVKQFEELFPHEDTCKAYLQARRWPEGPRCPRCGNPAVYDLPSRKWHWQCEKLHSRWVSVLHFGWHDL